MSFEVGRQRRKERGDLRGDWLYLTKRKRVATRTGNLVKIAKKPGEAPIAGNQSTPSSSMTCLLESIFVQHSYRRCVPNRSMTLCDTPEWAITHEGAADDPSYDAARHPPPRG